ncbi:MAG: hypothetical protein QXS96_04735 [Candidatus Caldarchaeum sp.]
MANKNKNNYNDGNDDDDEKYRLRNFKIMEEDLTYNHKGIQSLVDYIILNAGRPMKLYYDSGVITVIPIRESPPSSAAHSPPSPSSSSSAAESAAAATPLLYLASSALPTSSVVATPAPPPSSSYPLFNDEVTAKLAELVDHMYQEIIGWRKDKFEKTDTTTAAATAADDDAAKDK